MGTVSIKQKEAEPPSHSVPAIELESDSTQLARAYVNSKCVKTTRRLEHQSLVQLKSGTDVACLLCQLSQNY